MSNDINAKVAAGGGHIIDVCLEFDRDVLAVQKSPDRTAAEASRHTANEVALNAGGHLRHTEPIEVRLTRAVNPAGFDVILIASRWIVDGATPPDPGDHSP